MDARVDVVYFEFSCVWLWYVSEMVGHIFLFRPVYLFARLSGFTVAGRGDRVAVGRHRQQFGGHRSSRCGRARFLGFAEEFCRIDEREHNG